MMTSHRKALTISLAVDKDKSMMGSPLRIPRMRLSPGCGEMETQIHWTKITEHKARYRRSQHNKNLIQDTMMQIASRKPCLVLTDVMKTEKGRAYLDSLRWSQGKKKRGRPRTMSSAQRVTGEKRVSQSCRDRVGGPEARTMGSARKSRRRLNQETLSTPKHNQERRSLCSRRLNVEAGSAEENGKEEDAEELEVVIDEDSFEDRMYTAAGDCASEDEERVAVEDFEVVIDENTGEDCKYTAVVDCGLMLNSGPVQDPVGHVPSVHGTKWKDPTDEDFRGKKRKKQPPELNCNGRNTPKRGRESVLRLSGEASRAEGPANKRLCPEDSGGGGGESETPESEFVQITVEAAEGGPHPVGGPVSGARKSRGSLGLCPSPSQDDVLRTGHSEPIVLSSDDEEGGAECQRPSAVFYPPTSTDEDPDTVRAKDTQTKLTQEDISAQELHPDMGEVVRVVIKDPIVVVPVLTEPHVPSPYSPLPFSALHCGGCRVEANGDIMASDQRLLIPVKDASGEEEVMLTLQREELLQYSVWELEALMALGLGYEDEGSPPPAFLLLYVTDSMASTIESDMRKLSVKQQETFSTGKASPFLLLCLKDPLVGLQGSILRSILDIVCLNSLLQQSDLTDPGLGLEDIHTPLLSLDDSLQLIRRTGLDPHLLCLVGEDRMEPAASITLDWDVTGLKMDSVPEPDAVPQDKPDEDEKIGQKEHSTEESSAEPIPIYTVCHRRLGRSYTVSVCKPDSSWTKYKHQGLARRLIQFPPPPSKGGITVTMEDLQCLDSGQFLNDVIIDFYLKYLIQNASAEVAERSHIFSSFFYKQLTRRDNASEDGTSASSQRQRRHQRVKTWTRHVDIFNKDFLFVPVNQESHWYLVVICFPGLEAPRYEVQMSPASPKGVQDGTCAEPQAEEETHESKKSNGVTEALHTSGLTENQDAQSGVPENQDDSTKEPPPGPLNCTEQTCKRKIVCKRPCILIMDSLKISHHERVFKLVREYLQSEWEVRRGSVRDFGAEQMKSSHCRVPLQDNTSDCGLYLLQYVESFLKDPVVQFDLPLYLQRWFSRQQVRRKRDEIRDLVLHLCRRQNL